jgi:ArsR family transcriptional regulator
MTEPTISAGVQPDIDTLAACCKALASPIRLQMVQLIHAAAAPLCACDIEESFALSQPTISHHLKILRDAGVVTTSSRGTNTFYQLNYACFQTVIGALELYTIPHGELS